MKAEDLYLEFVNSSALLCGLCGNYGIVDTRGIMHSPATVECGVLAFCICPNGRSLKKSGVDLERWPTTRRRDPR